MSYPRYRAEYLFERDNNLNPRSHSRTPLNKYSSKNKWAIFKLKTVYGLVSHHGYAEIIGQTKHLYQVKNITAPTWKMYGHGNSPQKKLSKLSITEYYATEEEARLAVNIINKMVSQEHIQMKNLISQLHDTYFDIIDTALLVR